jgi:type IV pilus assembly protein PilQ
VGSDFGLNFGENSESSVPFPAGSGLGIGILNTDVEAVLHALAERNQVNLLSRPRVVTMDNQESVIEVGDQIPFKKLNQFGVTSFEFKDATVQLVVKPHIIGSEFILLEVAPKADFQNGFTPDGTPIISTRKASTKVKVRNGETIVIGGLIRDSLIKNEQKVPILGDIPLLGLLFKSTKSTKVKTELIIFITPVILDDELETQHFQKDFELRKKMRENFK